MHVFNSLINYEVNKINIKNSGIDIQKSIRRAHNDSYSNLYSKLNM